MYVNICMKHFSLYGCTMFRVIYKAHADYDVEIYLAINLDGIKFVNAKDRTVAHDYRWIEIETITLNPTDNYMIFELKNNVPSKQKCFMFELTMGKKKDIASLIASYSPEHASWLEGGVDQLCKQVKGILTLLFNPFNAETTFV